MMRTPTQPRRPEMPLPELIAHIVFNVVFALSFGFFAMRYDSDPEDCLAETDNNHMLSTMTGEDAETEQVNVGERFRFCF